jgi:ribosomal protein S21
MAVEPLGDHEDLEFVRRLTVFRRQVKEEGIVGEARRRMHFVDRRTRLWLKRRRAQKRRSRAQRRSNPVLVIQPLLPSAPAAPPPAAAPRYTASVDVLADRLRRAWHAS